MNILLIMDPDIPVPPKLYGGHERLVYLFAERYKKLGHEVILLAGPGSSISGKITIFGRNGNNQVKSKLERFFEILKVWQYLFKHYNKFDLIHNFGRLAYLLPVLNKSVNKIMTYGRYVRPFNIKRICLAPNKNLIFTAPSNFGSINCMTYGRWKIVYNAIDFNNYTAVEKVLNDAPLVFLGRLDKRKGADIAIKIAKQSWNRIILAGNMPYLKEEIEYFKKEIGPLIDNNQVVYVGAVDDFQKNYYLGQAKALLFPIREGEPFGLVMIEAMACGTPVIGFRLGSVPEVIDEGVTGYVVDNYEQMIGALNKVDKIDRRLCREQAEKRFDIKVIADQYLNLFNS
jgi:glycosyltransferase involved in cell wall biosynthesis